MRSLSIRELQVLCGLALLVIGFLTTLARHASASQDAIAESARERRTETEATKDIAEIRRLLEAMPDWPPFVFIPNRASREKEEKIVRSIEDTMRRIARYPSGSIRAAMKELHQKYTLGTRGTRGLDVDAKLFLLNKYLFDLPETVRRDSRHFAYFLTGWAGMPMTGDPNTPKDSDKAFVRWPWRAGRDGQWHLTGRTTIYMGPPYRPLRMFDYFRREFGRRKVVRRVDKPREKNGKKAGKEASE